jgi:hypothetical protein
MGGNTVTINRAPVLTLWAAVVAERMGYDEDAALTMGKVLAGLNAQSKGRMLGIYGPPKGRGGTAPKKAGLGEDFWVELCGRGVPMQNAEDGVRACVKDRPVEPDKVRRYLGGKFGDDLDRVREAMRELAGAFEPDDLEEAAYGLYEQFRPQIARGRRGWGQKGELDLGFIRSLAPSV